MKIFNGDCLEEMKNLPDKSIDLFICDLPYGETNCGWDTVIDMEAFWVQFKRLRKSKRTACIHFCSTKFGYSLIKSWEKGFKMDMVWKKRNKTGGLASRYRPMRNHEMVYFFYEQAPKYNRDKYHKRINNVKMAKSEHFNTGDNFENDNVKVRPGLVANFEPPNPASVIMEVTEPKTKSTKERKGMGEQAGIYSKENMTFSNFEPPNPASVIEEETDIYGECKSKRGERVNGLQFEPPNPVSVIVEDEEKYTKEHLDNNRAGAGTNTKSDIYTKEAIKKYQKENGVGFEPPNPASVIEETVWGIDKDKTHPKGNGQAFEPPNPASVIEGNHINIHGLDKSHPTWAQHNSFEPPNPASVLEEFIEAVEDEPVTMFESGKVFIGKRNHQTEKPQDILEFFLKYWSDEGDVILDPTMGSGSTGVACKKLGREFIGFELTEKYFEVAKNRLEL